MIRKVIDTSYFENEGLIEYLSRSPSNFIILTESTGVELYKSGNLYHFQKKIGAISKYSNQVLVLKNLEKIYALKAKESGFQRRMICSMQTREFNNFCKVIDSTVNGNAHYLPIIRNYTSAAQMHVSCLKGCVEEIPSLLRSISDSYTGNELKMLRKKDPWSDDLLKKVTKNTLHIGARMLAEQKNYKRLPATLNDAIHSYIFRYAVICHVWMMGRISAGAIENVNAEKTFNDLMDCNYVAYATCFDGILTTDIRMQEIYDESMDWIGFFKRNGKFSLYQTR